MTKRGPEVGLHATLSFEEALLGEMVFDKMREQGAQIDCRIAVPGTKGFSQTILGARDSQPVDDDWEAYFESLDARIFQAVQSAGAQLSRETRELLETDLQQISRSDLIEISRGWDTMTV